ncbi:MAG: hypothetical protein RLZZ297_2097, partial [Chloroflexota bacterium]
MSIYPWLQRAAAGFLVTAALLGIGHATRSDAAPTVAPAESRALGSSFRITCTFTKSGTFDPIVMPGMTGMSHLHQFFGSRSITDSSTPATIRDSRTSCSDAGDSSGYWVPALKRGSTAITPSAVQVIFTKTVARTIVAHPRGMVLIAGSARTTTPQSTSIAAWTCSGSSTRSTTPQVCPVGQTLIASIRFPECWDGRNLDSSDHKSHVAYATAGTCKAGTIALPQIELRVSYPRQSTVSGLALASGSLYSLHADFMNG